MKRPADQPRNDAEGRDGLPVEADPVWDLLAQSPPPKAGPRFVTDVVWAARLEAADPAPAGWLGRVWAGFRRRPVLHLAPVAAAAALAVFLAWPGRDVSPVAPGNIAAVPAVSSADAAAPADSSDEFAELEDVAAGELLAEADLSKFSDDELLVLLGF